MEKKETYGGERFEGKHMESMIYNMFPMYDTFILYSLIYMRILTNNCFT
jgi:hypothetical protein